MILFSVIIPHYNSVESLKRLILSIPQDEEIQMIIVDDKSTVDTGEAEALAISRGGMFLYNTTDRKGAGTCRNLGLQKAVGKWLVFADADDCFLDGGFDILRKHSESDADVIYFSPVSCTADYQHSGTRHLSYEKLVTQYADNANTENELLLRYRFSVPWTKMVSRRMVLEKQIRFDETAAYNDMMFSARTGSAAARIEACIEPFYCVTESEHSLTTEKNESNFWVKVHVFRDWQYFIREKVDLSRYPKVLPNGMIMLRKAFQQGYRIRFIWKIYCYFLKEKVTIVSARKFWYGIAHSPFHRQ